MAIEEVKLYVLYVVETETHKARLLACSHDTKKLQRLGHTDTWGIPNDPNVPTLRARTKDGKYPAYLIYEEPFVS